MDRMDDKDFQQTVAWHVYDPEKDCTFLTELKGEAIAAEKRGCRVVELVPRTSHVTLN